MSDTLYDTDFVRWTERQAEALRQAARAGSNPPLDWENLAEEIEDLGKEIRHRIEGLTGQILVHLLKLACSPSGRNHPKWMSAVDTFRVRLRKLLDENPALRARYPQLMQSELESALKLASREFRRFGEDSAVLALSAWKARGFTPDEVLADGLYPAPGTTEMVSEDE